LTISEAKLVIIKPATRPITTIKEIFIITDTVAGPKAAHPVKPRSITVFHCMYVLVSGLFYPK